MLVLLDRAVFRDWSSKWRCLRETWRRRARGWSRGGLVAPPTVFPISHSVTIYCYWHCYSQSNRRETVLQSRMNCVNQIYLSQLGVSNLIYNLKVACPSKCGASYFIYIVRQIYLTSCTCRCFEYRSICLQSVYRIHLLFKDTSRSAPSAPLSSLSTSDPLNVEALKLGARYSILDI